MCFGIQVIYGLDNGIKLTADRWVYYVNDEKVTIFIATDYGTIVQSVNRMFYMIFLLTSHYIDLSLSFVHQCVGMFGEYFSHFDWKNIVMSKDSKILQFRCSVGLFLYLRNVCTQFQS